MWSECSTHRTTQYELPIKPFCFASYFFLTWRRMSCLRQKVNNRGNIRLIRGKAWFRLDYQPLFGRSDTRERRKSSVSLVFTSRRLTGDIVASCNWQIKVGDLFQWGPGPSAMDRRRTQICANNNQIGAISTIPPGNINQIILLEYFESANVCIKHFYRRQSPACLRSWTQFNFGGKPVVNAWDRLWFGD